MKTNMFKAPEVHERIVLEEKVPHIPRKKEAPPVEGTSHQYFIEFTKINAENQSVSYVSLHSM